MKPRWQEPLEQVAHFALGMAFPAISAWREWRQWGPGDPVYVVHNRAFTDEWLALCWAEDNGGHVHAYYPEDRVRDAYRDFSFALYGAQVTIVVLVGVIVWLAI